MRRNTLTPARSRMNSTAPSTPTGYFSQSSLLRRDPSRNPRDPHFMATSVEMINEYLQMSSGNEQIPLLTDRCPSYKHFQMVFKRIVSYFNPNIEKTTATGTISSFGDEAHAIIKSMKYPYSNELNKSHLTTTNPHSWPVILAFLRWLVEMVHLCEKSTLCTEKTLTDGYRKFMEGDDHHYEQVLREKNGKENTRNIRQMEQLTALNDILHEEIRTGHLSTLNELPTEHTKARAVLEDEKQLQVLIERLTSVRSSNIEQQPGEDTASEQIKKESHGKMNDQTKKGLSTGDISELKNKLNDLLADKRSIQSNFPPLEQKEKRYLENIQQLSVEIENTDTETPLRERDSLRTIMEEQKAKIKNIEQQTSLKNELIVQLEHIKKEKQSIYEESNRIDTQISEKWDHHERYRHDLSTLLNKIVESSHWRTSLGRKKGYADVPGENMNQSIPHRNGMCASPDNRTPQNQPSYSNGLSQNIYTVPDIPWFSEEAFLREINTLSDLNDPKSPGHLDRHSDSLRGETPDKENDNQGYGNKDTYGKGVFEKEKNTNQRKGEIPHNSLYEDTQSTNTLYNCTFKDHLNDLIAQLEYAVTLSREHHSESVNGLGCLKNENISKNKRIINLSRIFLEKKEVFEKINVRTKNEMVKLENELMALSTSCGNNLLQSEQAVHYNSIKREKVDSLIQMEQAQIKMVVSKFYNEMVIEIEALKDLVTANKRI